MAIGSKIVKVIFAADDRQARSAMQSLKKEMQDFGSNVAMAGAAIGAAGLAKMAYDLVQVNTEYQKLNASLKTVTGSAAAADVAFADLKSFAAGTPFQLTEVVQAFIRLKSLGLDPSNEALLSYGNTASAMGKTLEQVIEAVADASVGEFERLKEFGIKAKSEGQNVSLTFQDVTTKIGKNSDEITSYLNNIGKVNFAGAMSEQMNTLGGAFSNLQDAYNNLLAEIGSNSGINTGLIDAMRGLTTTLQDPAFIEGLTNIATLLVKTADAAARIGGSVGREMGGTAFGYEQYKSGKIGFLEWATTGADEFADQKATQNALAASNQLQLDTAVFPPKPTKAPKNKTTATGIIPKYDAAAVEKEMWIDAQLGRNTEYVEGLNYLREVEEDSRAHNLQAQYDHDAVMKEMELDRITSSVDAHILGEEAKRAELQKTQDIENSLMQYKMQNAQMAVDLLMHVAGKSKAIAIAGLVVTKGLAMAETFISTQTAAAAALAPPPLGLGPVLGAPLAASVQAQGYIRMGLIAATGLFQASSMTGNGQTSQTTSNGGTFASPFVEQPITPTRTEPSNTVNVTIVGNVVDHDKFAREVIPSIQKAFADGVA